MSGIVEFAAYTVEKVKRGDARAFEALYHEHKRAVYSLCLRGTKDAADAEDLTQEVFLQVHRKVKDLRDKAYFKAWLYRVTMNTIFRHLRKQRVNAIPLQLFIDSETAPIVDALQTRTIPRFGPIGRIALARAIGGLSEDRRTAVVLHDIEGMSHREIAASLGVPLNTTKSYLWRAHRQLRGILLGASECVDYEGEGRPCATVAPGKCRRITGDECTRPTNSLPAAIDC